MAAQDKQCAAISSRAAFDDGLNFRLKLEGLNGLSLLLVARKITKAEVKEACGRLALGSGRLEISIGNGDVFNNWRVGLDGCRLSSERGVLHSG